MKFHWHTLTAAITIASAAAFIGQLSMAGAARSGGVAGVPPAADIVLGSLSGPTNWGGLGGIGGYSIGSTKCNIGSVPLSVESGTNQHYIEADSMYRVSTSGGSTRIEQVGISWLFHGFCDLQQALCGTCAPACGGCCSALGVGCSSPNTASRMGSQSMLGPRYGVTDPSTGVFVYPFPPAGAPTAISKRIQVATADLDPALNPGATYYSEGLIIQPQDAQSGSAANNGSYRQLLVGALSGVVPNQFYALASTGATVTQVPAIHAWKAIDTAVALVDVDVPADGLFIAGHRATDLGGGQWHYEYAIFNQDARRSGQRFSVPVGDGVTISNIGFHGPLYHSGEPPDNQPWTATVSDGAITWATREYSGPAPAGNELTAYALRFGTLYNFRFDADAPPQLVSASLGLFLPGTPASMTLTVSAPAAPTACAADFDHSGAVNGLDLAAVLAAWGSCPPSGPCPADLNHDGSVNGLDLAGTLAQWGPC